VSVVPTVGLFVDFSGLDPLS